MKVNKNQLPQVLQVYLTAVSYKTPVRKMKKRI